MLRRVRDYAQERGEGLIDQNTASLALRLLEVDGQGLDKMDRKIMLTIIEGFQGGPVGIDTLSAAVNEAPDTIEDVHEPYLIQHGRDGYCVHLEPGNSGCSIYEHRPVPCRAFDCRKDSRIWLDFAKEKINPDVYRPDWPKCLAAPENPA